MHVSWPCNKLSRTVLRTLRVRPGSDERPFDNSIDRQVDQGVSHPPPSLTICWSNFQITWCASLRLHRHMYTYTTFLGSHRSRRCIAMVNRDFFPNREVWPDGIPCHVTFSRLDIEQMFEQRWSVHHAFFAPRGISRHRNYSCLQHLPN